MKNLRRFKIDIYGLSNDSHSFEFSYDDDFFKSYENSLVSKGEGSCNVELVKSASMIDLTMKIKGSVELTCDRSLELFDHPIDVSHELIYKFGDEEKELSENVFVIPTDAQEINIGDFLYEFISLEIPMKKLHPKFKGGGESDELIYRSSEDQEQEADPRWEELKKLK